MSYTDRETYYDPAGKQLKTGADAIWELDSSGRAVGLVGPDGLPAHVPLGLFNGTSTITRSGIVTGVSLIPSSGVGSMTLPANFFDRVGKQVHVRLCGFYSSDSSPGAATVSLTVGGGTYATTGPFDVDQNVVGHVWWWDGYITCRTIGVAGTISGNFALVHSEQNVANTMHTQDAAVLTPVTINTTIALPIDVLLTTTDAGTSFSTTCCTLWASF